MKRIWPLLFLLILSMPLHAESRKRSFVTFSNGQVQFGQSYLSVGLENFKIVYDHKIEGLKAAFLKDTLEWVKTSELIYSPKAELVIQFGAEEGSNSIPHLEFNQKIYTPVFQPNSGKYLFSVEVILFGKNELKIVTKNQGSSRLRVEAVPTKNVKSHYIDSSCSHYDLQIEKFDEYLSVYCKLSRIGRLGNERGKLDIFWLTPNYRIENSEVKKSYVTTFLRSGESRILLTNDEGKTKDLTFRVTLPKKLHRIHTAVGVGPYEFDSRYYTHEKKSLTGNVTFYGRFDLTQNTSFRVFDSFAQRGKDLFNNAGLYFAYDLARIYDDRVQIVALLGLQHIAHRTEVMSTRYEILAPQGGEITFHHAFGLKKYVLGAGGFYSSTGDDRYTNTWLRFGKSITYEVNYIEWRNAGSYARVFGLSLILPLLTFF